MSGAWHRTSSGYHPGALPVPAIGTGTVPFHSTGSLPWNDFAESLTFAAMVGVLIVERFGDPA